MKAFLALALFVAVAAASLDESFIQNEFKLFEKEFSKQYKTKVIREQRYQAFKANLIKIQEHNLSDKSWKEGITRFADLTAEEFRAQHLNGYVNLKKGPAPASSRSADIDLSQLPESVDWREKGAITAVKDQGACGSCWAFAAAESIESYVQINNGTLLELSAQHITSCTPNELQCGGTGGCQGSIPNLAFTYTQLFGLTLEADYPYTSGDFGASGDCDFNGENAAAMVRGYELLPRNNYAAVMDHLANKGPLSIAADASNWSFYTGGVFDGCPYDQNININHAIQLVGYGTDAADGDYWIVRNSWGPNWGEDGYIRMKRNSTPMCGTDSTPLSGTACVNDGNDEQYVCGTCAVLFDVVYPIGAYAV